MAEKAGFRFEGVLRQYVFMGGKYHDSCVYSLLRDEWGGKKVDSENSLAS
ncbi:hypothetical protein CAter10_4120 [Collimonas arenae]|nr:hypothetical protein CAter10_4120 [Collimonas arenae]